MMTVEELKLSYEATRLNGESFEQWTLRRYIDALITLEAQASRLKKLEDVWLECKVATKEILNILEEA